MADAPSSGAFAITPPKVAARAAALNNRVSGALRRRERGQYDFAVSDPDGQLVCIGWPSRLIRNEP